MDNNIKGPLVSDKRFFTECLDRGIPEMEKAARAAEREDYELACSIYAEYMRAHYSRELFFTSNRRRMNFDAPRDYNLSSPKSRRILADAEKAEQHTMVSCSTPYHFEGKVDWFSNPTYNKYAEWTWQLSRHAEFISLADAYMLTGDERWARAFAELWRSWAEQAVCPEEPTSPYATLCWRTIEAGIRMFSSWPYAIAVFLPSLSDRDLTDWSKSVWEHGNRLYITHSVNNWLIMEMEGLLYIGILYPWFEEAGKWKRLSFDTLIRELKGQIYGDGFQVELTTEYHRGVIFDYTSIFHICIASGMKISDEDMAVLERSSETALKLMRPDGGLPDINDGVIFPAAENMGNTAALFPDNKKLRWLVSGGKEGNKPEYTSVMFENAGIAVMRSGWDRGDTWGLFDAGVFGAGHQHEDKLNFLMQGAGGYILTEANRYAYDSSEMRRYCLATEGHNTVMVNGCGQSRRRTYRWSKDQLEWTAPVEYHFTDEYDYVKGFYDEGYGEDGVKYARHERTVIFVRKSELKPYFLVIDRLISEEENDYETLWHIDSPDLTVYENGARCDELTLIQSLGQNDGAWISAVRGQRFPAYQGWSTKAAIQGAEYPVWCLDAHIRAGSFRNVTLLCPDGAFPVRKVTADSSPASTAITLVLNDGTEINTDEEKYR